MNLRKLQDLPLTGKKVFLRLDLNVPIKDGVIQDTTRITEALPTLKYILSKTNKVAIASHLGRPKGGPTPEFSLEVVGAKIAELLGDDWEVIFASNYLTESVAKLFDRLRPNQFVLLENVRFHPGEEKNDPDFASALISGFDFFVNDAFGTSHRAHASVVGAGELVKPEQRAAGFLIEREVQMLESVLSSPQSPFTVVMGGAKVSDKISVILSLLNRANHLLIGGAMAYTFLKYRGNTVGSSRIENDKMDLIDTICRNADARRVQIHLPTDHLCADHFGSDAKPVSIDTIAIPEGLMGLDIGPKTISDFSSTIQHSKTVFWNGPMGVFEWPAFSKGTMAIAHAMAECSAKTVAGGGDSVSAINKAGVASRIDHVSTGGGASLEFLEGKVLPGIKILALR